MGSSWHARRRRLGGWLVILGTGFFASSALVTADTGVARADTASVTAGQDAAWSGWAELGGYLGGSGSERGEAALFLPLMQSDESLVFTDVRGKLFEDQVSEINAAVGFRHMLPAGWNLGVWAGGDHRHSSEKNTFWAASGGVEALSEQFDVRINGYWALTDPKRSPGTTQARIEGSQIYIEGASEVPLSGVDGEIGTLVPLEWLGADPATQALRIYAGGFHFDADEAPDNISGPKARIEFRVDDIIPVMPGSRLSLEGEWRSDEVRGGNVEAGVRFRLPFTVVSGGAEVGRPRSVQWRRMTDGLERDTDIVTEPSGRELVEDAATGVALDRVAYADATTGITAPAAANGGNTLIVVDGSAGTLFGPQTLQANQTVVGGGGSVEVRGRTSGAVTTLTAPGARPTLRNLADAPTLNLVDRTHVAGLDITGIPLNAFNDGVSIGSSAFVVLDDVSIRGVGGAGINAMDGNTLTLRNVSVGFTPFGPSLAINNANQVTVANSVFDTGLFGLFANDSNQITISNSTISNMCNDGVRIDDDNTLVLSGVTVSSICGDAVAFDNRNGITITGTLFSGIGFDVLFGFDDNTLNVSDVTVSSANEDFIEVRDGNSITVTNSTATGLGGRGYLLSDRNTLSVTGGSVTAVLEGLDADDNNTINLTNTAITSTGGEEGVDISDGNVLTVTGTTISANGNNGLEMTVGNQVTVNMSVLAGAPTNTIRFDGAGNAVSGLGNVDNSAPTTAFCSDIGGQVGSIGFTNGTSCP